MVHIPVAIAFRYEAINRLTDQCVSLIANHRFGFAVINTGTTIVTFLMVFLIQRTQNKDAQAIHLKLNEIVAAMEGASNRLIDVEDLTEEEIVLLHKHYQ